MPGIDFDKLRTEITMEQVLNLLEFQPTRRQGDQWYGHCPLHPSTDKHQRAFSVNVAIGCFYCHKCHRRGDHFKLWAAAINKPLHPAMIELCQQLGHKVPWIHRW
jgi:DNA primase